MLSYAVLLLLLMGTRAVLRRNLREAHFWFIPACVILAGRFQIEGDTPMAVGHWVLCASNAWGLIRD
jgi:hypothetical protein